VVLNFPSIPSAAEGLNNISLLDHTTSQSGAGWGLGWFVIKDTTGTQSPLSPGTFGHGGRYGTFCFIDPQKDLIGIFMIHREGGSDERQAFMALAESSIIE
jgi:CubicO group peptidase (beta-lactamase class C family)